jgi:hypothetical protein
MYIDCEYKGSIAYNTVIGARREELLCRIRYTKMAIDFHTKEGNSGQIKFFTDELNLIEKRLKLKSVI